MTFVDGTAPVSWDFGDNLGPYSKAEILKATHVCLTAGTYTVSLTVNDAAGAVASTSTSITVSDFPAATGGNIVTAVKQGSPLPNSTHVAALVNNAYPR